MGDPLWHVIRETGQAMADLLLTPYFYIAILLVWWQERRLVTLQRKMYHVRLYGTLSMMFRRIGAGMLVGLALSAASLAVGAKLSPETLLCVWVAMLLLALLRLRYICLAYAAGALGALQFVLGAWVPDADQSGVLQSALEAVVSIDVPGLLFVAGLLHMAEGLLVRQQNAKLAIPLYLEGKRGKPIGAYAMTGLWPVPLLGLVPATDSDGFTLPWMPLFGDGAAEAALWTLLAFPVLIGFSDRTVSFWPAQKARASGNALIIYGALIALLAVGAFYWGTLAIVASAAVFVLHEALVLLGKVRESGRPALYSHDGSGVRILAVLPGTPAAELGMLAGETITKVNGMTTITKEDLHAALQLQSAFCKLEVVNREGHLKFLQRARFAGEHHQLGLVLAPDDEVDYVAVSDADSLWKQLRQGGARRRTAAVKRDAEAAESLADKTEAATTTLSDGDDIGREASLSELREANSTQAKSASSNDGASGGQRAHLRAGQADADTPSSDAGLPPRRVKRS